MATTPDKTENRGQADGRGARWKALGDFTTTVRVLPISGLALAIGCRPPLWHSRCCV